MNPRAERIKSLVPMDRVLSDYGYSVREGGGEQQFRCDLHGDGSDNAPSARVYPQTNLFYCFACGRARDVVTLVMEKEGAEFHKACLLIEKKYNLPVWVYEPRKDVFESDPETEVPPQNILERMVRNKLTYLTQSREVSLSLILKLWEGFDLLLSVEKSTDAQWKRLLEQIPDLSDEGDGEEEVNDDDEGDDY